MIETLLITLLIVAICFGLLGIGIWIKGKFPNFHIDGNKALNDHSLRMIDILEQASDPVFEHGTERPRYPLC